MPLQPDPAVYRLPYTKGTADAATPAMVFDADGSVTVREKINLDADSGQKPEMTFGTVGPPTQPSTRLLNLLQEAFDAGEDPDLTFDDFIRYALQGKMLTIEVL